MQRTRKVIERLTIMAVGTFPGMERELDLPDLGSTNRERKKRAVAAIRDEQSELRRLQVINAIRLAAGDVGVSMQPKTEA
jgi:hypothetical protein